MQKPVAADDIPWVQGHEGRVWSIRNDNHEGLSIHERGGRYFVHAWAENWDDTWSWETEIAAEELLPPSGARDRANYLLHTRRIWTVWPPSWKAPYKKTGLLDSRDGFTDGGHGGKS
jgi:hypothetical protein